MLQGLDGIRTKLDREVAIANFEAENEAWKFMDEYTRPKPPEPPPQPPDTNAITVGAPPVPAPPQKRPRRKRKQSTDQQSS